MKVIARIIDNALIISKGIFDVAAVEVKATHFVHIVIVLTIPPPVEESTLTTWQEEVRLLLLSVMTLEEWIKRVLSVEPKCGKQKRRAD